MNVILQTVYNPNTVSYGFILGKSIVDNAKVHINQPYVYNIDLKDFFPSIEKETVQNVLKEHPFSLYSQLSLTSHGHFNTDKPLQGRDYINEVISSLVCYEKTVEKLGEQGKWETQKKWVLPQGAPTSPILSNIVCQKLDDQLMVIAKKYGLVYTRYADDITFSGKHDFFSKECSTVTLVDSDGFTAELNSIILQNGFHINKRKVRLQKNAYRQEVTGLTVNNKVNVQKRFVKKLRVLLHRWELLGYKKAEQLFLNDYYKKKGGLDKSIPNMRYVIGGRLQFLGMVKGREDNTYKNLQRRYDDLNASDKKLFSSSTNNGTGVKVSIGNKPYDGGDSAVIGSNERDTTEGLVAYLKNYKASRDKGIAALSSMTYYPRISADFKSNPNDRFSLHDVVKLMALRIAKGSKNESLLEMRLSPDLEVTDLYLSAPGGLAKYKEDLLKNQVSVQGVRSVQIELKLNSNIGNLINIVDGYLSRSAISYQGKSKDFVEECTAQSSHSEKFAVLKKYGFLTVGQLRGFVSSHFSEDELNEAKAFHNEDLKRVYEKLLNGPLAVPFMPFHSLTIKPYDKSEAERITYSEAESLITELERHSMVMQKDGKNFPMLGCHITVPYKYDKEHFAVDISFFGEKKRVSIEVNGLPFAPDGDVKQGLLDLQKSIAELEKIPRNTFNDKLDLIKSLNASYIGNFIEQNRSFFAGATAFKSPFAKYNQALKSHYIELISKRGPKYFTFGVNQLPLKDKSVTGDMIIQALKKYVSDLEARLSMSIENDYLGNKLTVPFHIAILGRESFQVAKSSLSKMRIETSMIGMPIVHFNVSDLVGISKPATETTQSQPELDPFGDPNNIPF